MSVVGLDLGGTKLSGAFFSPDGRIIHRTDVLLGDRTGRDVGTLIAASTRELIAAADSDAAVGPRDAAGGMGGSTARVGVRRVGIAIPGIYRAATGTVWAPNIPGWDDYPLMSELRAALPPDVEVHVDSDRACAILGETWCGRARGSRNAIFLAVGTGIGAGILCEGVLLRGAGDAAGAIGWLALDRPYRQEYPAVGCFEYHASGSGLAAVARRLLEERQDQGSTLREIASNALSAHDVFAAADDGDAVAIHVIDDAIGYLGMAIANLVSLFNPERIILGGGVFGPGERYLDRIRAEAKRWAQPISITQVSIEISSLGGDAVLYGAGALALRTEPFPATGISA